MSGLLEWLVVAGGVEGECADELSGVCVDDADVLVGDEELDGAVLCAPILMMVTLSPSGGVRQASWILLRSHGDKEQRVED